jgi:hypothetical protein
MNTTLQFHIKLLLATLVVLIVSSLLLSCGDGPDTRALEARIDSLHKEVNYLRDSLRTTSASSSNARVHEQVEPTPAKPEESPTLEEKKTEVMVPEKKIVPEQEPIKEMAARNQGQVEYYSGNTKAKSLEITPWKDGRRELRFYSPDGNLQYTQKDVNMSYHIISEVKSRHPNGAIARIEISENPGASLYFYTTTITFNTMNVPEWKTTETYPPTLENSMNNSWYWVAKDHQWKKQETAIETLTPPNR